jgi:Uma2 family endonuclease
MSVVTIAEPGRQRRRSPSPSWTGCPVTAAGMNCSRASSWSEATTIHQFLAMRLLRPLADACPEGLCVVPEPAVMLGPQTEFDPDLVVVRMDQIGGAKFTEPPLLVVEIRSPSTALIDLNRKKAAYERFGVPSYWIVNPDPPQPELTVFELRDGGYALVAKTSEPFTVGRPFAVSIDPADLTRGLPVRP